MQTFGFKEIVERSCNMLGRPQQFKRAGWPHTVFIEFKVEGSLINDSCQFIGAANYVLTDNHGYQSTYTFNFDDITATDWMVA